MAACTSSIHVFLGHPHSLLSRGIQSIINFGILSSGILLTWPYRSRIYELKNVEQHKAKFFAKFGNQRNGLLMNIYQISSTNVSQFELKNYVMESETVFFFGQVSDHYYDSLRVFKYIKNFLLT